MIAVVDVFALLFHACVLVDHRQVNLPHVLGRVPHRPHHRGCEDDWRYQQENNQHPRECAPRASVQDAMPPFRFRFLHGMGSRLRGVERCLFLMQGENLPHEGMVTAATLLFVSPNLSLTRRTALTRHEATFN